ncbi:MAG: DNA-processing protein DprA [Chloroflexi bacterium]|nr:DNA-processing protein DprA [Chloroflexota bacterium]
MPDDREIKYWIGFTRVPGIGKVRLSLLKAHFGSLARAWKAPRSELVKAGLDAGTVNSLVVSRPGIDLEKDLSLVEKYKIKVITFESPDYPVLLKETHDYPAVLYVRGELVAADADSVAVVGTRKATSYGRQVTEDIVGNLALNGITIISGLARGIDTIAHRAALEAGGRTIAVFACGLDIVYPPENLKLAKDILANGALVSEHPLGTTPRPENFPRRNRIMSGLSRGVLIVESGEKGGALITASFALDQNREVFAVPGSILSGMSRGPNRLIQDGAKLVRNHLDILEELRLPVVSRPIEMKDTLAPGGNESIIIKYISEEPAHVDEICRASGLDTSTVVSCLAIMELNGLVRQIGGMTYALNSRLKYK